MATVRNQTGSCPNLTDISGTHTANCPASTTCFNNRCTTNAFGGPCSNNGDCAAVSGQFGSANAECINGACTLPVGSECSANNQCASQNCQGLNQGFGGLGDGGCGPGLAGSGCQTNSDCAQGVCSSQQCTFEPNGSSCSSDAQCNTNSRCSAASQTCQGNQGASCSSQSDCAAGYACYGSTCSNQNAPGSQCFVNYDQCVTGCTNGDANGIGTCATVANGGACTASSQCSNSKQPICSVGMAALLKRRACRLL